jgi:Fe2+ or Zn2+ uptake regulation protein
VQDLDRCHVAGLVRDLSESTGFEIDSHWLELHGRCAGCRSAAPAQANV